MRRLARLIWGTDFDPALRPLLAAGFLLGAVASIASGWLGGHLSDYVGRRPVMLAAEVGFMAVPLAMIAVGHQVIAGLAVMASFGVFGSMFNAAQSAMVADLLPPDRREAGYASLRHGRSCASPRRSSSPWRCR